MMQTIAEQARALGCEVLENELLSRRTTFRIGGAARLLIEVNSTAALATLYAQCCTAQVPCMVLGNGSNMLVSDSGYNGVVLHLSEPHFTSIVREKNDVIAGAGAKLTALTNFARAQGLTGIEFAHGIPGSVGGAVYMNAGAYGGELKDVLVSCEAVTREGKCITLSAEALDMRYRHTALMTDGMIVTSARVRLMPDNTAAVAARMDDYMNRRKTKQPLEFPSAGSVFKRPEGHFAGALIEQCGLKGCTIGGAQVSEKHAGFIINRGGATAADVRALVKHIQAVVLRETGVALECEILQIGP